MENTSVQSNLNKQAIDRYLSVRISTVQVPRSLQQLHMPVFHSFSNVQTFPVGCVRTVLNRDDWMMREKKSHDKIFALLTPLKQKTKTDYSIELKWRFALKSLVVYAQLLLRHRGNSNSYECIGGEEEKKRLFMYFDRCK